MRYALGIDGGGSKCEALLVDEAGNVAGRGLGGQIHWYYDPPEVIQQSYRRRDLGRVAGGAGGGDYGRGASAARGGAGRGGERRGGGC